MFCPKCGSIMLPKKDEKGNKVMNCSCGHSTATGNIKISEQVKGNKEIEVIEEQIETLPLTDEKCPKCSHRKAYFWTKQTRAADEPETKFMRCEKCGHQWRDYS